MIYKSALNNKSIVVENTIFILVAVFFGIILAANGTEKDNIGVGWAVIACIAILFVNLVFFKIKGKKTL